MVKIDEPYRDSRAVATTIDDELYLTEDRGKHWRKLKLPEMTGTVFCELDTHPFEKDYFLVGCMVCSGSAPCNKQSYASNNGGKNFRKIESPNSEYWGVPCEFACKSRDSIFSNKDLIYCLDGGKHFFNGFQSGVDVFYTDDFGKSINFIDQFTDRAVSDLRILDSHILVFTLEDKFNKWSTTDLWVSNDGFTFNKAFLPTVLRNPDTWSIIEDGLGRIIIPTCSSKMEEGRASPIFISDSSGLQFHLLDITAEDTFSVSSLATSKTLKGTMWAQSMSVTNHPHGKISFDYGDTWSNLKVVRSPNQRKDPM